MASLQDKLKELGVQIGTSQISDNPRKKTRYPDLMDVLPGAWEETAAGDCFVIRKEFLPEFQHGSQTLNTELSLLPFETQSHLSGISQLSLSDFLFIDTETTGLAGGAGTYVFLIGAAKYLAGQFQFAQFFLQDPGVEAAQLAALEQFAASTKAVISYNGKSFDLPRIKTRYSIHGWPDPFQDVFHLDLLHIARRIWKNQLPSCTLGDLEHHILELEREELDIPGWKVAEYFFTFLQDGDPQPLEHVLYHNEVDVLSLIALLGYINQRLTIPLDDDYADQPDLIPIGIYLEHLGEREKAISVLTHALKALNLSAQERLSGLLDLASIYKKNDQYQAAIPLWIEGAQIGSSQAKIELAKYYEHQTRDYQEAIHWTLSALEAVHSVPPQSEHDLREALEYRLNRLKIKAKQ